MSRILILGGTGQLATSLRGLIGNAVSASRTSETKLDLTRNESIYERISRIEPEIIVNAAGMTRVDDCEREKQEAYLVNSLSVKEIVRYCRKHGARLIHISTDYVFDGRDGNYKETSIPHPINFYGLSKLIGDTYALSYDDSLVIRTSGVFGYSRNFPLMTLEKLEKNETVRALRGFYSPIYSGILARAVIELMHSEKTGILNVAGERITRMNLAVKIADKFKLDSKLVVEDLGQFDFAAERPFDSSLDSTEAKNLLSFDFHSIDRNLDEFHTYISKRKRF